MPVKSTGQAVAEALGLAMDMDESVFLAGEGIGTSIHVNPHLPTHGLLERFGPRRVRDTPVSEAAIAGLAVGASCMGLRPVVEVMFFPFITLASDMLVNHAAKLRYLSGGLSSFPLTVRVKSGTFSAGCQHSHYLEAWLAHVPGLKVVCPSNPADAKGLLLSAIFDPDPVVVIEEMPLYWTIHGEVPAGDHRVPLGRAAVARPGADATLATYGGRGARGPEGRRDPGRRGHRTGSRRPAQPAAPGCGHGGRLRAPDRAFRGSARRHALLRLRRGAGGHGHRDLLRPAQGRPKTPRRAGHPRALHPAPGGLL